MPYHRCVTFGSFTRLVTFTVDLRLPRLIPHVLTPFTVVLPVYAHGCGYTLRSAVAGSACQFIYTLRCVYSFAFGSTGYVQLRCGYAFTGLPYGYTHVWFVATGCTCRLHSRWLYAHLRLRLATRLFTRAVGYRTFVGCTVTRTVGLRVGFWLPHGWLLLLRYGCAFTLLLRFTHHTRVRLRPTFTARSHTLPVYAPAWLPVWLVGSNVARGCGCHTYVRSVYSTRCHCTRFCDLPLHTTTFYHTHCGYAHLHTVLVAFAGCWLRLRLRFTFTVVRLRITRTFWFTCCRSHTPFPVGFATTRLLLPHTLPTPACRLPYYRTLRHTPLHTRLLVRLYAVTLPTFCWLRYVTRRVTPTRTHRGYLPCRVPLRTALPTLRRCLHYVAVTTAHVLVRYAVTLLLRVTVLHVTCCVVTTHTRLPFWFATTGSFLRFSSLPYRLPFTVLYGAYRTHTHRLVTPGSIFTVTTATHYTPLLRYRFAFCGSRFITPHVYCGLHTRAGLRYGSLLPFHVGFGLFSFAAGWCRTHFYVRSAVTGSPPLILLCQFSSVGSGSRFYRLVYCYGSHGYLRFCGYLAFAFLYAHTVLPVLRLRVYGYVTTHVRIFTVRLPFYRLRLVATRLPLPRTRAVHVAWILCRLRFALPHALPHCTVAR